LHVGKLILERRLNSLARPKKEIDPEQVKQLAAIQCSYDEMASVLGCDPSTLTRRFAQAIKKGRDIGFTSLKRKQYEMAMKGNTTMLIWLGKQYLGQADSRQSIDITATRELQSLSEEELVQMAKDKIKQLEESKKEINNGERQKESHHSD